MAAEDATRTRAMPLVGQGPAPGAAGPALLAIGFRPFFLLAALFAAGAVPSWLFFFFFSTELPGPLPPLYWHAHEMLFGYTTAVVAGFLLTAAQNWTGQVTARGGGLLALVVLWLAGRFACAFGFGAPSVSAAVDLAFLPVLALVVARPIVRTRNRRNAGMPIAVLALGAANACFWWGALEPDALAMLRAQRLSLDLVALLILVIGGRILPGFTANAIEGLQTRPRGALDSAGVVLLIALVLVDALAPRDQLAAYVAALAALVNAARLFGWGGTRALGRPILAVLHLGFACTALALGLRAYALLTGAFAESIATHLLTVGGIGGMTLGMMARVALGHTGRPLVLAKPTVAALFMLALGAVVRVVAPLALPSLYIEALVLAGALWTLAFAIFLAIYAPILLAPRADGRPL